MNREPHGLSVVQIKLDGGRNVPGQRWRAIGSGREKAIEKPGRTEVGRTHQRVPAQSEQRQQGCRGTTIICGAVASGRDEYQPEQENRDDQD